MRAREEHATDRNNTGKDLYMMPTPDLRKIAKGEKEIILSVYFLWLVEIQYMEIQYILLSTVVLLVYSQ